MSNILISIVGHFFKRSDKLVGKYVRINEGSGLSDNFGDAEFNVGDIVLGGLKEDWDNMLGNLVLHNEWHNSGEGVKATHSVVVAFFVDGVLVDYNWNVFGHDPVLLELFGEESTLGDSHISNTGSGVSKVPNEDRLQMFDIGIFSESDGKIGNKFKD